MLETRTKTNVRPIKKTMRLYGVKNIEVARKLAETPEKVKVWESKISRYLNLRPRSDIAEGVVENAVIEIIKDNKLTPKEKKKVGVNLVNNSMNDKKAYILAKQTTVSIKTLSERTGLSPSEVQEICNANWDKNAKKRGITISNYDKWQGWDLVSKF